MRIWVRNASFLLLVGCALGNVGLLSSELYRLLGFLTLLVLLATFDRTTLLPSGVRSREVLAAIGLTLVAIVLGLIAPLGRFHFHLFLILALYLLARRGDSEESRQLGTYLVALTVVGLVAELVRLLPVLWHLENGIASIRSAVAQYFAREDRNLGPTAMALPLLASAIILAVVREAAAARRRLARGVLTVLVLGLTHLLYLVLLKYYAHWIARHHPEWDLLILNSQHLFLLLGASVLTLLDPGRAMRPLAVPSLRRSSGASLVAFTAGLLMVVGLGWETPPPRQPARVMIYDAGFLNWRIPVHGRYGERSAGMFGMLPSTLEAVGFDVVVRDDLDLLEGPDRPDCLIMINIQEFFDEAEKRQIWDWIEDGGGLLCLGDHTGVAGIRGPFNDLLQRVGIRYRFDSSTFFGNGWNDALDFRNHPLNRDVQSADDFQIWVGATLDIDWDARPVIVGRYGYSDIGDPANIRRSYLGDRRYNPDEQLGDVVLVADARYGRGKVLVFGDTSGYQNLSLGRSLETVARSLHFLASRDRSAPGTTVQKSSLALLLLLLGICLLYARSVVPLAALVLGLAAGSAAVRIIAPAPPPLVPRFLAKGPEFPRGEGLHVRRELAVLDRSHGGRFTLKGWTDRSVGGLQVNLARNGYFPVVREEFPRRELEDAALLLILSPTRSYRAGEIEAIEAFLRKGGTAIVTVGYEEFDGSRSILERFGLSIANVPLGRLLVPTEIDTLPVEFHEAWPIVISEGTPATTLLSRWDLPLAVERAIGEGRLILIGDSSFFHDSNLETRDLFLAGNIEYLRKLTAGRRLP